MTIPFKIELTQEILDELILSLCTENTNLRKENKELRATLRLGQERAKFALRSYNLAVDWLLAPDNHFETLTRHSSVLTGPKSDIRAVLQALLGDKE